MRVSIAGVRHTVNVALLEWGIDRFGGRRIILTLVGDPLPGIC
jgi:hypothetical protein